MRVKIGKFKVSMDEFIKAVIDNTNGYIAFDIKDSDYDARVRFTIKRIEPTN